MGQIKEVENKLFSHPRMREGERANRALSVPAAAIPGLRILKIRHDVNLLSVGDELGERERKVEERKSDRKREILISVGIEAFRRETFYEFSDL